MKIFMYFLVIIFAVIAARILVPPQPMFLPEGQNGQNTIFASPTKAKHWASNMPQHARTFAAVPVNVVIDVDADLHGQQQISVKKDGVEYGIGNTSVDQNRRSMRRKMKQDAPGGKYAVSYRICTASGCDNGSFEFAINGRLSGDFEDHLGRADIPPDIGISIENDSFVPKKIRIRKNTRVIWTNNDGVNHSVTTDANYFPFQNSDTLQPKEAFELVFSETGEYPYHSSSNPEVITGSLLVED